MKRREREGCPFVGKNHPRHNPAGDGLGLNQGTCGYCGNFVHFVKRRDGLLVPKEHNPLGEG
jgi:hypothetical protein